MKPTPVKLVADHKYDTRRLRFVCFLDGDGFEYEAECFSRHWADWFDSEDMYTGPWDDGVEPVFEATSVFLQEAT